MIAVINSAPSDPDAMAPDQPTGWPRREFFDDRDKYYVPKQYFDLTKVSPLNLRQHKTYGAFFPKTFYDQTPAKTKLNGDCWGTCVANATAAAFVYEWKRAGLPAVDASRLFIYFNARQIDFEASKDPWDDPKSKKPKGQGSYIRLAFKALDQRGVCAENDWTYDDEHFATQPTKDAIEKALENRMIQYSRLDPDQPEGVEKNMTSEEKDIIGAMTLLRLRQCLAEGHPVVFGFRYYWKYAPFQKTDKPGFWTLPALPRKNGPASDEGGHAVLAIGFDDKGKRILCQNSWGESVDGAPLFYIGYDWIKDFEATSDFWMVRLVEKKEKQKPNARESRL